MEKKDFFKKEQAVLDHYVVSVSRDSIFRNLGDEAVILNIESNVYCGLNEVGARIWELLKEPKSVKEIQDTLLEEYEVEIDQCKNELLTLLQDLLDNELIDVKDKTDK
jgi:hypothetical protein